jgi:small subunit ribosomal protein S36
MVATERAERLPATTGSTTPPGAPDGPGGRHGRRPWYLRPPRLVLVATVAFGLLTGFWSVLTPLTEAPDEPAHLGLVLHVADTGRYPTHDGLHHTVGLFDFCVDYSVSVKWCRTSPEEATGVRVRDRLADDAPPKDDRPYWDDPGFQTPEPGRLNQMPQHPPLYYAAMAAAVRVERAVVPGDLSIDTQLAFLRLLNVLLVLPIPWLGWCSARRLGAGDQVGVVAALIPLGIPQLTHIGATLNNDNLFMVLGAALMALLAGVVRGDRSRRTVVLVGLVTGLALLTKGFGVVFPPIVALAYLVGAGPDRSRRRSAALRSCSALAVAFAVSGWWYLAKLVTTGHIMPSIEDTRLSAQNQVPGPRTVGEYLDSTTSRIVDGFWGAFGWRRVQLPTALSVGMTLLCVALAVVAVRRAAREAGRADAGAAELGAAELGAAELGQAAAGAAELGRAEAGAAGASAAEAGRADPPITRAMLAVLLCPAAALCAFVVIRSAVIYAQTGRLAFQQGRYLFAGLSAAAVVVAIGAQHLLGRRAVPAVVIAGVLMQSAAIACCLVGWWDADSVGLPDALRAVVAWSGWPDPIVVALLAALPVQLVLLVRATRRYAARTTVSAAAPSAVSAAAAVAAPISRRP